MLSYTLIGDSEGGEKREGKWKEAHKEKLQKRGLGKN